MREAAATMRPMSKNENQIRERSDWSPSFIFPFAGAVLREALRLARRHARKLLFLAALVGVAEWVAGPLRVTYPLVFNAAMWGLPVAVGVAGAVWLSRDPATAGAPRLVVGGVTIGLVSLVLMRLIWWAHPLALLWGFLWVGWRLFLRWVQPVSLGDVFWAEVEYADTDGSKIRPVVVISKKGAKVDVFYVTSQEKRAGQPGYVEISRKGWEATAGRSFVNVQRRITMTRFELKDYAGSLRYRDWKRLVKHI